MSDRPIVSLKYMQTDIAAYGMETYMLNCVERGVHSMLIHAIWQHGGELPGDTEPLRMAVRRVGEISTKTFATCVPKILAQFFYKTAAGNWRSQKFDEQMDRFQDVSGKRKAAATSRWKGENGGGEQAINAPRTTQERAKDVPRTAQERAKDVPSNDYQPFTNGEKVNDFNVADHANAMDKDKDKDKDKDNGCASAQPAHAPAQKPPEFDLDLFPEGDRPNQVNTASGRWLANAEPVQESEKIVTIDPIRQARFDAADLFKKYGAMPPETGAVVTWIRDGIPAETILTAIESRLPRLVHKPLSYFDGIVRELHAARLNPKSFQPAAHTGTRRRTMQDVLNDFYDEQSQLADRSAAVQPSPADQPKLLAPSNRLWPD